MTEQRRLRLPICFELCYWPVKCLEFSLTIYKTETLLVQIGRWINFHEPSSKSFVIVHTTPEVNIVVQTSCLRDTGDELFSLLINSPSIKSLKTI